MPKKTAKIPARLQHVLWSCDIKDLDLKEHKAYIIHQVLIYGSVEEIKWLFDTYSKKEVINVFLKIPYKNYPAIVFHFVKNYLLGLRNRSIDEQNYVTSISGWTRPRTAGSV